MFIFWLKFLWSLFLSVDWTISQHRFRWWLGAKQVTSHYLNQCWLNYIMRYVVTRPQWVKTHKYHWNWLICRIYVAFIILCLIPVFRSFVSSVWVDLLCAISICVWRMLIFLFLFVCSPWGNCFCTGCAWFCALLWRLHGWRHYLHCVMGLSM